MDRLSNDYSDAEIQIRFSGIRDAISGWPRLLAKTFGLAAIFMSVGLSAQSISPQMMEQVKLSLIHISEPTRLV